MTQMLHPPDESSPNMTEVTYQYTPLCLHSHDMKLECGWCDTSDGMEWKNLTLHPNPNPNPI